jgi:hypothetical protein
LYSEQFATFGEDEVYRQSDAEGFIRIFGLPQRIRHLTHKARMGKNGGLSSTLERWQEKVGSGV